MTPLALRQWGEYDADFEAVVEADGRFSVERGSYVTGGRRFGRLSPRQQRALARLAAAVDTGAQRGEAGAVRSRLQIGDAEVRWAGPPPTEPLAALVRALVTLPARAAG